MMINGRTTSKSKLGITSREIRVAKMHIEVIHGTVITVIKLRDECSRW
jgi:hypothetical protein